jgi:hypothetical protein
MKGPELKAPGFLLYHDPIPQEISVLGHDHNFLRAHSRNSRIIEAHCLKFSLAKFLSVKNLGYFYRLTFRIRHTPLSGLDTCAMV